MARTARKSKHARKAAAEATLARALAPEEIRRGDYVAVLHEVVEFPSWFWCDDSAVLPRDEVVRVRYTPWHEAAPLKVSAVCLPFVFVKQPCGRERTLDVRRSRLARLDEAFARMSRRAYKTWGRGDNAQAHR